MAFEARLELLTNAAMDPRHLVQGQLAGRPQRVDPRPPERLVHVDVPHPGERSLVEEGGLDRGAASLQALGETLRRERRCERLAPDAGGEVRLELLGLEEEPRAEAPHVAIRYVRSVV